MTKPDAALHLFHPVVRQWFVDTFGRPTAAQAQGWPAIARGESVLILAPTGSGKTLAAFLWCIERLMFQPVPPRGERCRVLYISPLKALAVDVDRNLRAPIAGITQAAALRQAQGARSSSRDEALAQALSVPTVGVRSGDTPATERARFQRDPTDILITTPESFYLLLTSNAREALRSIDTVIVDEIHALVPTKRGAHLALSIERLEALAGRPLQRIGLSATQRPLDEVARFLGGVESWRPVSAGRSSAKGSFRPTSELTKTIERAAAALEHDFGDAVANVRYRPVTIVDAGSRKPLELLVEVPVEDMARLGGEVRPPIAPPRGAPSTSIWSAVHPRLVDLIRAHRSTLIFVNNRRTAERLAAAINEQAAEPLARAHHGSLAPAQRSEIEEALKGGTLRALVATSSLELGIDMGAIDLVIQIEAPPSVASGLQRIGRAGHRIDAPSRGVIFPKFRADLLACATATRAMHAGLVESSIYPRNPLDILAQQVVAMAAMDRWPIDELFDRVRRAAPFATLSRAIFESVLDMLAGRYASDEFADLKPRLTWDRIRQTIVAREGARRVAVANAGTIPDRGLYGVFLTRGSEGARAVRVGELDEEMVFETKAGETFVLGASTWRVDEITHDRVLVSPAPGEPGKMPFWRGDAAGRPIEFGRLIGTLVRELLQMPPGAAVRRLVKEHDLDERAAENLVRYLKDQTIATGAVPSDDTIVIERCRDELGDWRVCVLTPFGSQIHAPWSMAAVAQFKDRRDVDAEAMWTNDGFVLRVPETDEAPDASLVLPAANDLEALVIRRLGASSLLAAKFREAAARALLLPKRRPGGRTPLWQQRRRASDLLAATSRFPSFPIVLEAYRECLRDVFDIPALRDTLQRIADESVKVVTVTSDKPSPFASALLFGYVAKYIYEGDAPLAERRAQALTIDQAQLRELLGDADLRDLLDADATVQVERELQSLAAGYRVRTADGVHDLLLRLGHLSLDELDERTEGLALASALDELSRASRVIGLTMPGATGKTHGAGSGAVSYIASEDTSRYRDALGITPPTGVPDAFLQPVADPLRDILLRFARTHGPFGLDEVIERLGIGRSGASRRAIEAVLHDLVESGRLLEGEFRASRTGREWCHTDVLRLVRRRSLARIRREVEPVAPCVLGRLVTTWQGVTQPRHGADALLDAVHSLQGSAVPASVLESEILPARVEGYTPSDLDALAAAGEVVWCGVEPLGDRDGRVTLYLADHVETLRRRSEQSAPASDRDARIVRALERQGASFFGDLHHACGGGFPAETVAALWRLVWNGFVTNDTFHALRAFVQGEARPRHRRSSRDPGAPSVTSRRAIPPAAEGRWSLIGARAAAASITATEWSAATAAQLLTRYGLVTREVAAAEGLPGGFSAIYDVLRRMEERGRARRGYFVEGIAAVQFGLPAAVDLLRSLRPLPDQPEVAVLAATDPANPYGTFLKWPAPDSGDPSSGPSFARATGASVMLVNGALAAYSRRTNPQLWTFLPEGEPERTTTARAIASRLAELARSAEGGVLISAINGAPAPGHPLAPFLRAAGFVASALGYHIPRGTALRLMRPGRRAPKLQSSPFAALRRQPEEPETDS
ncbi:MAG: DEAD/DEAH box helicase [Acidobacteria bacterium]|nr:DEAD/DEAH box helicase [Acidobacteriota bacterium]